VDVASAGVVALFALFLVKESGIPVPVPGDLIVIGTGVAAARGDIEPVTLLVIVAASVVGGAIQYGLLRSFARPVLLRLISRVTSVDHLDRQTERLRNGGARSVAIARSTPGVRIVAIPACAIAAIPPVAFVSGLAIGNAAFIGAHFGLGFVLGDAILAIVGAVLGPLAVAGAVVAGVVAIAWFVVVRRRARREATTVPEALPFTAWRDACCPACLTLAAGERHP
jgi:membrane-associated protein